MGFTYVYRLQDETGAPVSAIVKAYMITRNILSLESIWKQIEELGTSINAQKQIEMMMIYVRLARRITRWFLRSQRRSLDIGQTVTLYAQGISELKKAIPSVLGEENRQQYEELYKGFIKDGLPTNLAHELAATNNLFAATDIIEIAQQKEVKLLKLLNYILV